MNEVDVLVLRQVIESLTDEVARLHSPDGLGMSDLIRFQELLTESNFYISGIIYSNSEYCTHEHDD